MDEVIRLLAAILSTLRAPKRPPWNEIGFFNDPVVTVVGVSPGNGWQPLVKSNPNRVVLALSSSAGVTISPDNTISQAAGLAIGPGLPDRVFTEAAHGNLCTVAWFASKLASPTITAVEVILREWPNTWD